MLQLSVMPFSACQERMEGNMKTGSFPTTSDNNKFILLVMDHFSKWPKAYTIPSEDASTVAELLVNNLECIIFELQ